MICERSSFPLGEKKRILHYVKVERSSSSKISKKKDVTASQCFKGTQRTKSIRTLSKDVEKSPVRQKRCRPNTSLGKERLLKDR